MFLLLSVVGPRVSLSGASSSGSAQTMMLMSVVSGEYFLMAFQSWLSQRRMVTSTYVWISGLSTPDNYPLPRIDDLLVTVSKVKYLTTLDLTKGYHQIALEPSTIPKTAFTSHCGKYE